MPYATKEVLKMVQLPSRNEVRARLNNPQHVQRVVDAILKDVAAALGVEGQRRTIQREDWVVGWPLAGTRSSRSRTALRVTFMHRHKNEGFWRIVASKIAAALRQADYIVIDETTNVDFLIE